MSDRPILFSAPMVRALLAGTKTQTRRISEMIRQDDPAAKRGLFVPCDPPNEHIGVRFKARYRVGDRLWVREAWRVSKRWEDTPPRDLPERKMSIVFEAGGSIANEGDPLQWLPSDWPNGERPDWIGVLRPGMFMPRWASRLTLTVTDVRVERLQDISEEDAIAEGVPSDDDYAGSFAKEYCHQCGGSGVHGALGAGYGATEVDCVHCETPHLRYRNLWNHINGPGSWDENPWVAAYTFTVARHNIDNPTGEA